MKRQQGFMTALMIVVLAACSGNEHGQTVDNAPEAEAPQSAGQSMTVEPLAKPLPASRDAVVEKRAQLADRAAPAQEAMHYALPAVVPQLPRDRERYSKWVDNPVKAVQQEPLSTFSIDVDGASYALARSYLNQGRLPPVNAVRSEEFINALEVDYRLALGRREPVGLSTQLLQTPWNTRTHLLQVGVQAWEPETHELPDSNYVFLLDVSGSMRGDDRLGLIVRAFSVMLGELQPDDTVALVTYASGSQTVLEPTPVREREKILAALQQLSAGGSTHGSDGIQRAYRLARAAFVEGGNNRVILATDGDMNVGLTGQALVELIERERDHGIYITVLGVGRGNYMDAQLEPLADHGDGNYYYLDSFREARRVLVSGLRGTAYTVAKDVKIQVEFNPAVVAEYRLIGYNNRQLANEDFNNDARDAGELGAGHTITALYEITLVDSRYRFVDERRYGDGTAPSGRRDELAWVKLRYKPDADSASRRIERIVHSADLRRLAAADNAVIAGTFAEKLRGAQWLNNFSWADLQQLAQRSKDVELREMIDSAALLSGE